jgi:hypothetical protein
MVFVVVLLMGVILLFSGGIVFTVRHWKKSTLYFRISFLCWLIIFWTVVFVMYAKTQNIGYLDPATAIVYFFLFPLLIVVSFVVWVFIWSCGFLIAKIASFVSNYRKRKHRR